MSEIDKRNRLGEEPFTYQITKNGTVTINYKGTQIKVVKDKEAERLIARIKAVENNILEVQLLYILVQRCTRCKNNQDN